MSSLVAKLRGQLLKGRKSLGHGELGRRWYYYIQPVTKVDLAIKGDGDKPPTRGKVPRPEEFDDVSLVVNHLRVDKEVRGVRVARLDDDGRGVVTIYVRRDKQLYAFAFDRALPGERLHLYVAQNARDRFKKRQAAGTYRVVLDRRGAASPDQVKPVCQHFMEERCGGCTFQHLSYEAQIREKTKLLALRSIEFGLPGDLLEPAIPSPSPYGFHGRTEFRFFLRSGVQLGLHPTGSPVPLTIQRCHLHPLASQRALEAIKEAVRSVPGALPFDERTGNGYLSSAVIRAGPRLHFHEGGGEKEEKESEAGLDLQKGGSSSSSSNSGGGHGLTKDFDIAITLVTTATAPAESMRHIADGIMKRCADVVGVSWSTEGGEPAVRQPGWRSRGVVPQRTLAGRPWLHHDIAGKTFKVAPEGSVRPNILLLPDIIERVCKEAKGQPVVWDAFCGQGFLGFALLAKGLCNGIVALDRSEPALDALEMNLKENGMEDRAILLPSDLGVPAELHRIRDQLPEGDGVPGGLFTLPKPDLLIADPGRNGLPKAFRRFLYESQIPLVLYIGSGTAFLKDTALLVKRGFKVETMVPFDSYPHHARLEVLVRLRWVGVEEAAASLPDDGEDEPKKRAMRWVDEDEEDESDEDDDEDDDIRFEGSRRWR